MKRVIVLLTALATALALAVPAVGAGRPGEGGPPNGGGEGSSTAEVSKQLREAMETSGGPIDVLISTNHSNYGSVIDAIEATGGSVSLTFDYADGLAATLPQGAVFSLASHPDIVRIGVDSIRTAPGTDSIEAAAGGGGDPSRSDMARFDEALSEGSGFPFGEFQGIALNTEQVQSAPDTYWGYTPDSMNAVPVWAQGNFGQDSLIAVIDTGIYDDHFMFGDGQGNSRVIGGVDLSPDVGTPAEGPFRAENHWHGTHVAGIAAGAGAFCLSNESLLLLSIELYTGVDFPPSDCAQFGENLNLVPLLGMAPAAELYAIKVFPHDGSGVPESVIIDGIEHAIDQKVTGNLDIDVINMSLGGFTGYDGRDLEDQTVDAATAAGITVVSAASNDGPYSMTINSPGTANSSITAGAIAHPVNTRVFWDLVYGSLGIGDFLYTDDDPQVIYFSSRGPTADGRDKPTASAIGVFVLSAFNTADSPQGLGFASGTSMATPGLAGTAALLNTWGENAGAAPYDIKQAIVAGSNPVPGFDELDQGAGLIDAGAAYTALQNDTDLGQDHPSLKMGYTRRTVTPKGQKLNINSKQGTTFDVSLDPGMSNHYYFELPPNAERVTVDVTDVQLGTDLGLNSFEFNIEGGVRDTYSPYLDTANIYGDAQVVIDDLSTTISGDFFGVTPPGDPNLPPTIFDLPLMPGYWKVVIENDWTSFDTISGSFTITVDTGNASAQPDESYSGRLGDHENTGFFPVGHGENGAEFELSWLNDYGWYPVSDMDLIIAWFDTNGDLHWEFGGATLSSPEMVVLEATNIESVYVLVDAFNTYGNTEHWELDVNYR